jgi:hypothetical protein
MSRPLRSTTTPASSSFTANTSRSASQTSQPVLNASGFRRQRAPSRRPARRPGRPLSMPRLLTFRARAADQAHAASTPGTTWPATRAAAKLIPRTQKIPGFDAISGVSTPQQRTPPHSQPGTAPLERLPGPHLTRSSRAFSLNAHHDGLQPTQHQGGLTPAPAGPTAGGPTSLHLSHSTAYMKNPLHDSSFSVRDALSRQPQSGRNPHRFETAVTNYASSRTAEAFRRT